MSDLAERLQRGIETLEELQQERLETGDPEFGYEVEERSSKRNCGLGSRHSLRLPYRERWYSSGYGAVANLVPGRGAGQYVYQYQ
jgi:hypothetical protein